MRSYNVLHIYRNEIWRPFVLFFFVVINIIEIICRSRYSCCVVVVVIVSGLRKYPAGRQGQRQRKSRRTHTYICFRAGYNFFLFLFVTDFAWPISRYAARPRQLATTAIGSLTIISSFTVHATLTGQAEKSTRSITFHARVNPLRSNTAAGYSHSLPERAILFCFLVQRHFLVFDRNVLQWP